MTNTEKKEKFEIFGLAFVMVIMLLAIYLVATNFHSIMNLPHVMHERMFSLM